MAKWSNSLLCIISMVAFLPLVQSQELDFSVHNIPDSLLNGAHAVIRIDQKNYHRKSLEKVRLHREFAITILDEQYLELADLAISYDKYSKVKNLRAFLLDEMGEQISKISKNDILDVPYYASFTLYSDNRIKMYHAESPSFPCTFHYSYDIDYDEFIGVSPWVPGIYPYTAVEKSSIAFKTPKEFPMKYLANNFKGEFEEYEVKDEKVYEWSVSDLPSWEYRSFTPPLFERTVNIHFSPGEISMDGYRGNTTDWQQLGDWIYRLNQDRNNLSDDKKELIKDLTRGLETDVEKCKAIYKHLQNHTRYVSIQLGIGGLQPIDAGKVESCGYGDCKALSNYMKAMLDEAGVHSVYAIIGTTDNSGLNFGDFSNLNQGDHAILCVPNQGDTIWLECTSQHYPFGHIGAGSDGKNALLIEKDKSTIVQAHNYSDTPDMIQSEISVDLKSLENNPTCDLKRTFMGNAYLKGLRYHLLDQVTSKENLIESLDFNHPEILHFETIPSGQNDLPLLYLNAEFSLSNLYIKAGNRLLLPVDVGFPFSASQIAENKPGFSKFYLQDELASSADIHYTLPPQYSAEVIPESQSVYSTFGTFEFKIDYDSLHPDKLDIHISLAPKKGLFSASSFSDYLRFMNEIEDLLNKKIVLKETL